MKIDVLDNKGKSVGELALNESVFACKPNNDLLAQYIHVFRTNKRQGTVSTKSRGEVSGGGKKPWRQKGTGRARHGSIRSPIWVKGGIAHGPKPRPWSLKLPKKMKRKAMQYAISYKYNKDNIKVVDSLSFNQPSTKKMLEIMKNIKVTGKVLFVLDNNDKNVLKSLSNINNVKASQSNTLNAYDVLDYKNIVFVKDAITKFQENYK